jgi:hypothetical protein
MRHRVPLRVNDYATTTAITHEYDSMVVHTERLTSVCAVPVVIDGDVRSVLYGAVRDRRPIGDRVLDATMIATPPPTGPTTRLPNSPPSSRTPAIPNYAPGWYRFTTSSPFPRQAPRRKARWHPARTTRFDWWTWGRATWRSLSGSG